MNNILKSKLKNDEEIVDQKQLLDAIDMGFAVKVKFFKFVSSKAFMVTLFILFLATVGFLIVVLKSVNDRFKNNIILDEPVILEFDKVNSLELDGHQDAHLLVKSPYMYMEDYSVYPSIKKKVYMRDILDKDKEDLEYSNYYLKVEYKFTPPQDNEISKKMTEEELMECCGYLVDVERERVNAPRDWNRFDYLYYHDFSIYDRIDRRSGDMIFRYDSYCKDYNYEMTIKYPDEKGIIHYKRCIFNIDEGKL